MGCNCGGGNANLKWQVTLTGDNSFPDGSRNRIFTTQSEANATALRYPGAVVAALR